MKSFRTIIGLMFLAVGACSEKVSSEGMTECGESSRDEVQGADQNERLVSYLADLNVPISCAEEYWFILRNDAGETMLRFRDREYAMIFDGGSSWKVTGDGILAGSIRFYDAHAGGAIPASSSCSYIEMDVELSLAGDEFRCTGVASSI